MKVNKGDIFMWSTDKLNTGVCVSQVSGNFVGFDTFPVWYKRVGVSSGIWFGFVGVDRLVHIGNVKDLGVEF